MVNSAADAAARMRKVGEAARRAQVMSVSRAALAAKTVHVAGLMGDAPGGRLRNVGPRGAKLGVRFNISGGTGNPSATVKATGPWQILNNPAKAHLIEPRRAKVLHFGDLFRGRVNHPGHRGKFTWQKAEPEAIKVATAQLNRTMITAVQQAFRG